MATTPRSSSIGMSSMDAGVVVPRVRAGWAPAPTASTNKRRPRPLLLHVAVVRHHDAKTLNQMAVLPMIARRET